MTKHANFSYSDVISMPTYERKYFLNKLIDEVEKKNEVINKKKR